MKRTVCVTRTPQCADCLLYRSCVYPYFYDTPPPVGASKMHRYATVPHPFVLRPDLAPGEHEYHLEFILFGLAHRHLPVFLHALVQAAQQGRGVAGNHLELCRLEQEAPLGSGVWQVVHRPGAELSALPPDMPVIPPAPDGFTLHTLSPLRIKRDGRRVGPDDFRFADLFGNLLRRVSMLMQFHGLTALETDFRGLSQAARQIVVDARLQWRDLTRYSARQKAAMQMGGVVGSLTVRNQPIAPFWPYLWLGQWVHAGSGATMGLGRYQLASLPKSG
ncbi:MAG: CRISPR system precrRNA processing endoribonuclease RAMP protein Cas6 [Thiobacillaceae bacterium]